MENFLLNTMYLNNPLVGELNNFLENEKNLEIAKKYKDSRFVGYVLDIGFDEIIMITSDPFKVNVGGIPRNSLLIMVPSSFEENSIGIPYHFTLLRVLDSAPTPLSKEVQQTYFELQKKSMPELDVFTQSELQWGALKTKVLGMFYPSPENLEKVEFSGDLNNYVSAHKYKVYSPTEKLLFLVCNTLVPAENQFCIGKLRLTECRLPLPNKKLPDVDIYLSSNDFKGTRTALFGKTRLGKSNVVKLIVQSILETTKKDNSVGQLIFDINGEYANDNPQDENFSIRSAYPDRCIVYALTPKTNTSSSLLKINFYTHPNESHKIIRSLLGEEGKKSNYIESFLSVNIPSLEDLKEITEEGIKKRSKMKIFIFWAILKEAGFEVDERELNRILPINNFHINQDAFQKIIGKKNDNSSDNTPKTLDQLISFLKKAIETDRKEKLPSSTKGKNLFDKDDEALLNFLNPQSTVASGPSILQKIRKYHSKTAGNFVIEILNALDKGKTVILDLGNAEEEVMRYFSKQLSEAVFARQTQKFTENRLGNHFIQLYFEEAHNLFGYNDNSDETKIYRRFAKEGAKYHIGMVYSTQSPTTVNSDLLAQTENFFIAHLASQDDVNKLAKVNIAFDSFKNDIMQAKTPGYIRMLTRSHRFVVSIQARKFTLSQK